MENNIQGHVDANFLFNCSDLTIYTTHSWYKMKYLVSL